MPINPYRSKSWKEYRSQAVKIAGGHCEKCGRSNADGVVLQVHHKEYVAGMLPWEYAHHKCEVLCKGCHAEAHGITPPNTNWILIGQDDLGGLDGICDRCSKELRYVFLIQHPSWGTWEVGEDCCDLLTQSRAASDHMKFLQKRKRFVTSPRWSSRRTGSSCIVHEGHRITVFPVDGGYKVFIGKTRGRQIYKTMADARLRAFDVLELGLLHKLPAP